MCDETKLARDILKIAVQVNGILRDVIEINSNTDENNIKEVAKSSNKVKMHIAGKEIKKIIYIKEKLINIVC